jgi:FlaA1/EpsC-like NDP-sugar epimerase
MKTQISNNKINQVNFIYRQSLLFLSIGLIISPAYVLLKSIMEIAPQSIDAFLSCLSILILAVYIRNLIVVYKSNPELVQPGRLIIHFVSLLSTLILLILVTTSEGRITTNEISGIFLVLLPMEIFVLTNTQRCILTKLNNRGMKPMERKVLLFIYGISIILTLILMNPDTFNIFYLGVQLCLSIVIFLYLMLFREITLFFK